MRNVTIFERNRLFLERFSVPVSPKKAPGGRKIVRFFKSRTKIPVGRPGIEERVDNKTRLATKSL